MKISFVTVNYNNHVGLEKTIEGLVGLNNLLSLKKTEFKVELIVIDGHSGGADKKILRKYAEHLDIIVSEEDLGVYDAMNKGIELATGEYINFMNSGDVPISNNIIKVLKSLDGLNCVYGTGEWTSKPKSIMVNSISSFWCKMPNHQAMFIPRHWHLENKYNLNYPIAADLDIKLKLNNSMKLSFIDLPLVICEPGGMSQTIKSFHELRMRANEIYQISSTNNGLISGYANYLKYTIWHGFSKLL